MGGAAQEGILTHRFAGTDGADRGGVRIGGHLGGAAEEEIGLPGGRTRGGENLTAPETCQGADSGQALGLFGIEPLEKGSAGKGFGQPGKHGALAKEVRHDRGDGLAGVVELDVPDFQRGEEPDHADRIKAFDPVEGHGRDVGTGQVAEFEEGALHAGRVGTDVDLDVFHPLGLLAETGDFGEKDPKRTGIGGDEFQDAGGVLFPVDVETDPSHQVAVPPGEEVAVVADAELEEPDVQLDGAEDLAMGHPSAFEVEKGGVTLRGHLLQVTGTGVVVGGGIGVDDDVSRQPAAPQNLVREFVGLGNEVRVVAAESQGVSEVPDIVGDVFAILEPELGREKSGAREAVGVGNPLGPRMNGAVLDDSDVQPFPDPFDAGLHEGGSDAPFASFGMHHQAAEFAEQVPEGAKVEDDGPGPEHPPGLIVLRHQDEGVVVVDQFLEKLGIVEIGMGVVLAVSREEDLADSVHVLLGGFADPGHEARGSSC